MPPNASSALSGGTSSNVGVLHSGNKIHKPELIKKIGGADVLKQAVNQFYDRLTVDPKISVFFEGANMEILRWHQFNIMSIAFHDIPEGFDLRDLILRRHQRLFERGLDENTYDQVLHHFVATLRDLKVPEDTIEDAMQVVKPYRAVFAEGAAKARQQRIALQRERNWMRIIIGSLAIGYIASLILIRRRK